jgi:signal transduction histidine kinase
MHAAHGVTREPAAESDRARSDTSPPRPSSTRIAQGTAGLLPLAKVVGAPCNEPVRLLEHDVAEIVHDLKSPLYAITMETVLLDDKLTRGDQPSGRRSLERINSNVLYLDRLVHDLLDVCALATGNLELTREPTELRYLLEEVLDRVVPERHRDRVLIDADHTATMNIDPFRIERVIANLVENAIKYAPAPSHIIVRLVTSTDGAMISVIDAGPGLAADDVAGIFEPYRRGRTSRGSTGSGLGLFVSKKIVEQHGGTIGVESILGVGTRFFFTLPSP